MTQYLLDAIKTKCAATSAITTAFPAYQGTASSVFSGEAAEGAPLPLCVFSVIAAPRTTNYGESANSTVTVQFAAYGVGHDATAALLKAITDAFDGTILTLAAGHVANATRTSEPLPTPQERDASGNNVWQWIVTYDFALTTR